MSDDRAPLLAVLIDCDNVPAKFAGPIFEEIATLGEASVRRTYGDFTEDRMRRWSEQQAQLGLVPHHQPANTVGKNASDIALVIDAMDLLHTGRFDAFVLVSSDSDFTRLAQRIREQGKDVFGFGEKKTPEAFRMACKRFIYVENLGAGGDDAPADKRETLSRAAQLVGNALADVEEDESGAGLGAVGQQLAKRYPDFDPRTYGYRKLSELVRALKGFEVSGSGRNLRLQKKG
ncbi:NYN domain-containing protein [Algicella marina]|uniref:NYN domain-containing protein n=1 Tax=Algicella marina TaxID=2683284 RepID=A0A6P1T3N5_9RHOB|nr:NYN domain-containing protein [Algicella marina]QHQ36355.1 NYN domain-containing protein [Algicella marina]